MTPEEFGYIKRAVAALESGECSDMTRHKILRTMSQICDRAADEIELDFTARVDQNLANENLMQALRSGNRHV